MKRSFLALMIICVLIGLIYASPARAQTTQTKQEKKVEKIKTKIRKLGAGEQVKAEVKLYNEIKYKGYVNEVADDYFVIVDKQGSSHKINYTDVDSIGGKNLSTGAKIAIGIGIGAGATLLILFAILASFD